MERVKQNDLVLYDRKVEVCEYVLKEGGFYIILLPTDDFSRLNATVSPKSSPSLCSPFISDSHIASCVCNLRRNRYTTYTPLQPSYLLNHSHISLAGSVGVVLEDSASHGIVCVEPQP
jgi:hypothetical protein